MEVWWQLALLFLSIPVAVTANLLTPFFRDITSRTSARFRMRQQKRALKRYQFVRRISEGDHLGILAHSFHLHMSIYFLIFGIFCFLVDVIILFAFDPAEWANPNSFKFVFRAYFIVGILGTVSLSLSVGRMRHYSRVISDAEKIATYRAQIIEKYGEEFIEKADLENEPT